MGVDLGKPLAPGRPPSALEVQAIVFKFIEGQRIPFDRDDLLQEVQCTILRRNRYPSAFDPRKATFAKYVWLVARNVLGHMLQREGRHEERLAEDELPEVEDERAAEEFERVELGGAEREREGPEQPVPRKRLGPRRRRTVEFEVAEPGAPPPTPPPPGGGKVVPFRKRAPEPKKHWEQLALPWAA